MVLYYLRVLASRRTLFTSLKPCKTISNSPPSLKFAPFFFVFISRLALKASYSATYQTLETPGACAALFVPLTPCETQNHELFSMVDVFPHAFIISRCIAAVRLVPALYSHLIRLSSRRHLRFHLNCATTFILSSSSTTILPQSGVTFSPNHSCISPKLASVILCNLQYPLSSATHSKQHQYRRLRRLNTYFHAHSKA